MLGHILEMSGSGFVEFYALSMTAAFGVLVTVWAMVGILARRPPNRPLALDELAYLMGGPDRVVHTRIAHLVVTGALRPSRNGRVRAVTDAVPTDDIETAVLSMAASAKKVDHLTSWITGDPCSGVKEIADAIRSVVAIDLRHARRHVALALTPAALVAALGVIRLLHSPSAGLVVVLIGSVLLLAEVAATMRRELANWLVYGHPSVQLPGYPLRDPGVRDTTVGWVAIGGLSSFPDREVRHALVPPPPQADVTPRQVRSTTSSGSGFTCGCGA